MGSRRPLPKCQVCCEEQSKYKCPSCLAPYCSLTCFKKHKEIPCKKSLPPSVEELTNPTPAKRSYEVDEPSWAVDEDQLLLIANSREIREVLKDADLRKTIQNIDGSHDPENQLTEALEGQVLHDIKEKILSIVSPQE